MARHDYVAAGRGGNLRGRLYGLKCGGRKTGKVDLLHLTLELVVISFAEVWKVEDDVLIVAWLSGRRGNKVRQSAPHFLCCEAF